jgi:hypothetical protein
VLSAIDEPRPSDDALVAVTDVLLRSPGRPPGDPGDLARVHSGAAAAARARDELEAAIAEAAAAGHSLRRIGAAAGLSHEQVRRILGNRHVS